MQVSSWARVSQLLRVGRKLPRLVYWAWHRVLEHTKRGQKRRNKIGNKKFKGGRSGEPVWWNTVGAYEMYIIFRLVCLKLLCRSLQSRYAHQSSCYLLVSARIVRTLPTSETFFSCSSSILWILRCGYCQISILINRRLQDLAILVVTYVYWRWSKSKVSFKSDIQSGLCYFCVFFSTMIDTLNWQPSSNTSLWNISELVVPVNHDYHGQIISLCTHVCVSTIPYDWIWH